MLLYGLISANLSAAYTAGDPPTADVGTTPDVTYYGVGMELDLSVENFEDKDCTDADPPVEEDDTLDTVEFSADNGATVSSPTSKTGASVTMPTSTGTVKITLKVNDKGDKADDGGLVVGGTKSITVEKPVSVSMKSNDTTNDGGKVSMQVKDSQDKNFKVQGVDVLETLSSIRYLRQIDGTTDQNPTFLDPSSVTDAQFTTLSSDGAFDDTFILHGRDAIADASGAENTCHLSFQFNQDYSIDLEGTKYSLDTGEGTYQRRVIYHKSKGQNGTWDDTVHSFDPNLGS